MITNEFQEVTWRWEGIQPNYRDVHVIVPSQETIIAMEINMILHMCIQFTHFFGVEIEQH